MRNKKEMYSIVKKTIMIVLIITPFLLITNFFIGNPIGAYFAHGKIKTYVNKYFQDYCFIVEFPQFILELPDGYYYKATAYAKNDKNINFDIMYLNHIGKPLDFTYNYGNFKDMYCSVIENQLTPLISNAYGENVIRFHISQDRSTRTPKYYFLLELEVADLEPYLLSSITIQCCNIIEQNEIVIINYDFQFITNNKKMLIFNLHTNQYIFMTGRRI